MILLTALKTMHGGLMPRQKNHERRARNHQDWTGWTLEMLNAYCEAFDAIRAEAWVSSMPIADEVMEMLDIIEHPAA